MAKLTRIEKAPFTGVRPRSDETGWGQNLAAPYTVMRDHKMQFPKWGASSFRTAIFSSDQKGAGVWWYGVAIKENPWPNLPQFKAKHAPLNVDVAHIFFHPSTGGPHGQGGYRDRDYSPDGPWINLFEKYIVMIGLQVAAVERPQLLIMPMIPSSGLGAFLTDWKDIVSQIVAEMGNLFDPAGDGSATIRHLVLSSYSAGIIDMNRFLRNGAGVLGMTRGVIDLDGAEAAPPGPSLSFGLASDKYRAFAYDQGPVRPQGPLFQPFGRGYRMHVPAERWDLKSGKGTRGDIHGVIPIFMLYDALMLLSLGY